MTSCGRGGAGGAGGGGGGGCEVPISITTHDIHDKMEEGMDAH